MITRKTYKAVANAINESLKETPSPVTIQAATIIVNKLSVIFKQDNPLFDMSRFEAACFNGVD